MSPQPGRNGRSGGEDGAHDGLVAVDSDHSEGAGVAEGEGAGSEAEHVDGVCANGGVEFAAVLRADLEAGARRAELQGWVAGLEPDRRRGAGFDPGVEQGGDGEGEPFGAEGVTVNAWKRPFPTTRRSSSRAPASTRSPTRPTSSSPRFAAGHRLSAETRVVRLSGTTYRPLSEARTVEAKDIAVVHDFCL